MKNIILLMSFPRTGSSVISNILNLSNNQYIISHGEILSDHLVNRLDNIYKKFTNIKYNSKFFKYAIENDPKGFIDVFKDKDKLALIHIHEYKINGKFRNYILNENNIFKVLIRRNLLESYVSFEKTKIIDKFNTIDTSNIEITIDIDHLINVTTETKSKYTKLENELKINKQKYCILNYNEYYDLSNKDKLNYIFTKFNESFGLELHPIDYDFDIELFKQDKSKLSETITNYDEVMKLENIWKWD